MLPDAEPMQPHHYWQHFLPADQSPCEQDLACYTDRYPARLPDGRHLYLPLRQPPSREGFAVASLILNQASFVVQDTLAGFLAGHLSTYKPDLIVGLPTLGLGLAEAVARNLGHSRMVACGTSRKFWYDDALSVPMHSITSPVPTAKRLYLDPRLLPLLHNRRVAVIDDVLSSGASMAAALGLLSSVGVRPIAIGAAMLQTHCWSESLAKLDSTLPDSVCGVLKTPLFIRVGQGWKVADETSRPR